MVRPTMFFSNPETAKDNAFQNPELEHDKVQQAAAYEFESAVDALKSNGVNVVVFDDLEQSTSPDSIFPNNWISTHDDGRIVLYPMYAENRRTEVRQDIVEQLQNEFGYTSILDWTDHVHKSSFLEGTGSLVLDRGNRIAYACISERTDLALLNKWAEEFDYTPVPFNSVDKKGTPIYHTNVMMSVAAEYAIVCLESIENVRQRTSIQEAIKSSGKTLIEISYDQINRFAGNMLEVTNGDGDKLLLMSQTAFESLSSEQIDQLQTFTTLVAIPIPTIERNGGGSIRCMIAEIFPPSLS